MKSDHLSPQVLQDILNDLERVKIRLERIEQNITQARIPETVYETIESDEEKDLDIKLPFQSEGSIEFRFGEYGMAWLGNIVLLFGLSFLVQYLHNSFGSVISAVVGFLSVGLIYTFSHLTRNSYSILSNLLRYNGHLLLYYFTARLHFFQSEPLISKTWGIAFTSLVLVYLFTASFRNKSKVLAVISMLLILVTGIISNSKEILAFSSVIVTGISLFLYYRLGWTRQIFVFITLSYIAHLTWLLNNPFMGNNAEFIASPGMGYFFLIATGFIFSLLALIPIKDQKSNEMIIASVIWNGLGFTLLLVITVITYFSQDYVPIFLVIAGFCIVYSWLLQSFSDLKITASIYALYGFLALSVSFFGIFGLPKAYMYFSLESLLVVSMALWFRSRFIVIMNSILFAVLIIVYLSNSISLNGTNFSFMMVAFITARIINWKKERLNIKAENIRNLYLVSGLAMTLIAFYKAFPESFITLSWMVAAILFFILSILIKNIKYRWLAIATMIATGARLIFFDMSNIEIGYRVLVFLMLAVISIVVSILYTKYFTSKKK